MSFFSDLGSRLRSLLFARKEERELAEELRFHLDMETEHQQRAGHSEAEARRRSQIELGGVEPVKEQVRDALGTRPFQDISRDITFTLRSLFRSPSFALVTILTLAIGIGGTTAVFSAVNAVLLQPLPYAEPGRLVRIYQPYVQQLDARMWLTPVHFLAYRREMSAFEATAAMQNYSETGADIGTGDEARRIRLLEVSADYFDVVRVRPQVGQPFTRETETGEPLVVLSHQLWTDRLASNPAVVGEAFTMNGRPFTIAGVMPAGYVDPIVGRVDAWVPLNLTPGTDVSNANNHYLTGIARLRPGQSIESAQAELDGLSLRLAEQYPDAKDARARLYPLKDDIVGSSTRALTLMLGGVGLVLVLVCVNIANLLLVRGSERAREFALRSALGAERGRLVRQMLIESMTLALAGAMAGLVVARLGMTAIVRLGAGSIPRLNALSLDPALLGFAVIIASLCAVVFGLAPALRAARTQPGDVLRDQSRSSTGGAAQLRLREWLVVSQVALAFVLLVGAGLLLASFQRLREVDLGVHTDRVETFEVHLPDARYDAQGRARLYEALATRIAQIPQVTAAGGVSRLPATGSYHSWGVRPLTGPLANAEENGLGGEQRVVSGEYFTAMGIPVLQGRAFDARDDAAAPDRVVISQSAAQRLFPDVDPLGQRLRTGGRESEVIGVVGDIAINNEGDGAFFIYHPHRQWADDRNWALTQVVATTGEPEALQPALRRVLSELDPGLVLFRPTPFSDVIGRGVAQRVFTLQILLAFAAVALALSALGIFGVLSYGVRLRSREFGIRLALGAEPGMIRRMVLRQGLTVTLIGIGIGLVGALVLARVMASMVFQISPLDPLVLAGAVLFMGAIAGLAAFLPAWRATRADVREVLQ